MTRRTKTESAAALRRGEAVCASLEGREDAVGVGADFRCASEPDHRTGSRGRLEVGGGVFGPEGVRAAPAVDVKTPTAKIGELTLENDF